MTAEQWDTLVNLSASFLLLALFLTLVGSAVVFYYLGHGLRVARRDMPGFLAEVDARLGEVEAAAYDRSSAALSAPIRTMSAWQGLKTGTRVLLGRPYRPSLRKTDRRLGAGDGAPPALTAGGPPPV